MMEIGIQLYSYSGTELSFEEKLRHAAQAGYSGVEFAGDYGGMTAPELRSRLLSLGLWTRSAHVGLDRIGPELPFLAELGVRYVICPYCVFPDMDAVRRVAQRLNTLGEYAKQYGIRTGFHNHIDEFYKLDGTYILDHLLALTDPALVSFQLDCGWAACAGVSPEAYLAEHAGRFVSIHIKENLGRAVPCAARKKEDPFVTSEGRVLSKEEADARGETIRHANVKMGTGNVDWRAVAAAALRQNPDTVFIVERESAYAETAKTACIAEDVAWLKKNL